MTDLIVNDKCVLKDVELILLDKDGTIIDINHYWGSMLKERAGMIVNRWFVNSNLQTKIYNELIDAMGIEPESGRMKPNGPVGVKPREFIVNVSQQVINTNGVTVSSGEVEDIFRKVDQLTAENMEPLLKLLPGVMDFLNACRKTGVQMAIVSTDQTNRVCKAMSALGLSNYFVYIVGGDKVANGKPAPDPAHLALDLSGISSLKVASIGDHPVDIEMGNSAQIRCNIGVLTGLAKANDFKILPCHIVNSFKELQLVNNKGLY